MGGRRMTCSCEILWKKRQKLLKEVRLLRLQLQFYMDNKELQKYIHEVEHSYMEFEGVKVMPWENKDVEE